MTAPSRVASALVIVVATAYLLRGHLAQAIVTRGDDALRAGRYDAAAAYYRRSSLVAGPSIDVLERLTLLALVAPSPGTFRGASRVADALVAETGGSARAYYDRGLVEWKERSYPRAVRDFRRSFALGAGPSARAFARAAARRAGAGS